MAMRTGAKKKAAAKRPKRRKSNLKGEVATGGKLASNGPPNGHTLSNREEKVLIDKLDRLWVKAQKAREEAASEMSAYRDELKRIKKIGFDTEAYIEARERDKEDHGRVEIREANVRHQLSLRGSPLAQLDMFAELEPVAVDDKSPEMRGFEAGKMGTDRGGNPYYPGTIDWKEWDSNWVRGQEQIAAEMQ